MEETMSVTVLGPDTSVIARGPSCGRTVPLGYFGRCEKGERSRVHQAVFSAPGMMSAEQRRTGRQWTDIFVDGRNTLATAAMNRSKKIRAPLAQAAHRAQDLLEMDRQLHTRFVRGATANRIHDRAVLIQEQLQLACFGQTEIADAVHL